MLDNLFTRKHQPHYSDETIDILRLIRSENVGSKTFLSLIKLFGTASNALDNIPSLAYKGGSARAIKVYSRNAAEQEIEALSKYGAYFVTYKDPLYSQLLLQIHDFPPILSCKGNVKLLNAQNIISIVGARSSSINARAFASNISKDLVNADYVIVSGLARGIDTAAHEASTNNTIAVVAGGIDHIYPIENKKIHEQIAQNSLLIAELPIGSKPLAKHFPQRNRIIAGLSKATVVIEAGIKSGSLITANFAIEQNREVFAVPGFPLDPRSRGSNKLIKEGAYLLESSEDIIMHNIDNIKIQQSLLEVNDASYTMPVNITNIQITQNDRDKVKSLLSSTAVTYDQIVKNTDLSLSAVYMVCLELELAGKITRHIGNKISLIY